MATVRYCWRCRADVPLLDETEWQVMVPLLQLATQDAKALREAEGLSVSDARDLAWRQSAGFARHKAMTGVEETNIFAVWHHRAANYGPPCAFCDKPLRTARARHCAECGRYVVEERAT